jgi:hypothetical protein
LDFLKRLRELLDFSALGVIVELNSPDKLVAKGE